MLVKKLSKPCMMKLELDSPGWTLAVRIMCFLYLCTGSNSSGPKSLRLIKIGAYYWHCSTWLVIVTIGKLTPERLKQKWSSLKKEGT